MELTTRNAKCEVTASQTVKVVMPLEIEENIEDTVVTEGNTAVLECKINGYQPTVTWYKDGRQIRPSNRIKIITDRKWKRIEINDVTEEDSGLYTVLISNSSGTIFSKANLQVGKRVQSVLTCPCPRKSLSPLKQLCNVTVNIGERIELYAEFNSDVTEFQWFKNNTVVTQNERIIILDNTTSSAFSIHCAKLTDSGIYTVVAKTIFGVTSSQAYVQVLDIDLKIYKDGLPAIDEVLLDEVDVNVDEEVRLICKARYDSNTVIKWFKSGALIECNTRLVAEEYSGDYIGLRILHAMITDSAEYSVRLENVVTGINDSSTCFLIVNPYPMLNPPIALLKRPLISTMSCCGSQVTFDCSFELTDSRYYYVVWHVGHFQIERSNSRFDVVCKDGEFLFHIKKLEPGMAGEVLCELRKVLPNQATIFVNSAAAHLAVVPPAVLHREKKHYPVREPGHRIRCMNLETPIASGNIHVNGSNGNGHMSHCPPGRVLMEIKYCRLEDDVFYYLHVSKKSDEMASIRVSVRIKQTDIPKMNQSKTVLVEWSDPHLDTWYTIDLKHKDFIEAGVSSSPSFEIRDPPVGKVLEFRVRTAEPQCSDSEVLISIAPTSPREPIAKACPLKDMKDFDSCFTNTNNVIGSGTFGSVMLVQNTEGEYYAAKFLKTRTQKKRDTAHREYQMMKELRHPKLVELIDAFVSKEAFVLVMDFLWGGELFDRIVDEEHIKEIDVVPYVRQICEALEYLHHLKIAHLDLKPENIICLGPNSRQVKLVDFGLARVLEEGYSTRAIYGTRDYVAPEVLNFEQLTLACDMWTLGVVTYVLLSGVMPFCGESWPEKSANITRANYNYDETAFKDISDLAKDFVDHLLVLAADKRMSASAALNHKWIVEGPPKGAKAGYMKRARENLKSYLATYRARWQRAGNVMIAAHRLRTQASNRSSLERASHGT